MQACLARVTQVWLTVHQNTSATSGNEFDIHIILHGQVSLAAVNQIYVFHEAIKRLQKSKDLFNTCFENVNIQYCCLPSKKKIGHCYSHIPNFKINYKALVNKPYKLR